MRIDRIELILVRLPLIRTFRTSSSTKAHIDHILVRVEAGESSRAGANAQPERPYYCPETTETCWHILKDFLRRASWAGTGRRSMIASGSTPGEGERLRQVGPGDGRVGRAREDRREVPARPARRHVDRIESGVSLGIEGDVPALSARSSGTRARATSGSSSRSRPGGTSMSSARSGAYPDDRRSRSTPTRPTRSTTSTTEAARRVRPDPDRAAAGPRRHHRPRDAPGRLATPVCLDESIHSADDARKAIDLGACRVVNIKVSRVGGPREAKRVHDVCRARGVPVWCGGMHEFGVGRAANLAVVGVAGLHAAGRHFGLGQVLSRRPRRPAAAGDRRRHRCPAFPGLGVEPVQERIDRHAPYD